MKVFSSKILFSKPYLMNLIVRLLFILFLVGSLSVRLNAKTLYVIADINEENQITIIAYDVQGSSLVEQTRHSIPKEKGGACSMAYDSENEFIFFASEYSNVIQIINGKTFALESSINVPGTALRAGMIYDPNKSKLYISQRNSNKLYVYNWDANLKTLTPETGNPFYLLNASMWALNLDLNNNILYVSNGTNVINKYYTNNWTSAGTITLQNRIKVIGFDIDMLRGSIYTGGSYLSNRFFGKYNITTGALIRSHYVPQLQDGAQYEGVMGVCVDNETGYVYITTGANSNPAGDRVRVFDSALNELYRTGDLGNPSDLFMAEWGYNPLGLVKSDGLADGEGVVAGHNISYSICYDNVNNDDPATNVILTDYLPTNVSFVSASNSGTYSSSTRQVRWNIGTLAANAAQSCYNLTVQVNTNSQVGDIIRNECTITSNEYGQTSVTEETPVVAPYSYITVNQPNGGEHWQSGDNEMISWFSNLVNSVDILYTTNNGTSWSFIAQNQSAFSGNYFWTIPSTTSSSCSVQIVNSNYNTEFDNSDNLFTIADIDFTNPIENSIVIPGTNLSIEWNYAFINYVDIDYSTDNGNTWYKIGNRVPASNPSFIWTIPMMFSGDIYLRIYDSDYPNIDCYTYFVAVKPYIEIVNPNGGECYKVNTCQTITWESEGIRQYTIDYSTNNGINWINIVTSYTTDNNYFQWVVPNTPSNTCLLRIYDSENIIYCDTSDYTFRITDSYLAITSPNGGEIWYPGDRHEITLTHKNMECVTIDYSNCEGVWNYIDNSLACNTAYTWTVPNDPSTKTRVRICGSPIDSLALGILTDISASMACNFSTYGISRMEATKYALENHFIDNLGSRFVTTLMTYDNSYDVIYDWSTNLSSLSTAVSSISVSLFDNNDAQFLAIDSSLKRINDYTNPTKSLFVITDGCNVASYSKDIYSVALSYRIPINVVEVDYNSTSCNYCSPYSLGQLEQLALITGGKIYRAASPEELNSLFESISTQLLCEQQACRICDTSDADFSIYGVIIKKPEIGDKLLVGSRKEIKWRSAGIDYVKIDYSTDGGSTWILIEDNYPIAECQDCNLCEYPWIVPNTPSRNCYLRITDTENSALQHIMGPFSIKGLLLTSPVGGEKWLVGTNQKITWNSDNISNMKIEYSTDNGISWVTIISSINPSLGSYDWNIPKTPSVNCIVRISDFEYDNINDMNSTPFTIMGNGILVTSPTEGDVLPVFSSTTISWLSENVKKVDILYSINDGNSWEPIAKGLSTPGSIMWTVPSLPSIECFVKIVDSENSHIYDVSGKFRIKGTSYKLPFTWTVTEMTGSDAIIIVPDTLKFDIINGNMQDGDAIGVFFDRDGELICGGYAYWEQDKNIAITVWGDDFRTEQKDGFANDEVYTYKLWDSKNGIEIGANADYLSGPDHFVENAISVLKSLSWYSKLTIPLKKGWSYISANLKPINPDLVTIMDDVVNSLDYMKNDMGEVYMPSQEINTIENWNIRNGYQINMLQDDELEFTGIFINPIYCQIDLETLKWYIVPYLPKMNLPIENALYSILQHLIMCKNYEGEIFFPQYGINKIGTMEITQGYKLCTNADISLVYPYWESDFTNLITQNLILNPDFESWSGTTTTTPTSWTYTKYYSGDNINQEVVENISGSLSVKIVNNNTTNTQNELYQTISNYQNFAGRDFEFGCWVKGATTSNIYIMLSDGISQFPIDANNTYSGSGDWEYLKVRGRLASNLSNIRVSIFIKGATTCYIDNSHLYCWDVTRTLGIKNSEPNPDLVLPNNNFNFNKKSKDITLGNNLNDSENNFYKVQHTKTGNDATLIINSSDLTNGDEIGIFTYSNRLIGSGIINDNKAVITIWGDNRRTTQYLEGASDNEELILRLWKAPEKKEYNLAITNLKDLLTNNILDNSIVYRNDRVWQASIEKTDPSLVENTNDLELNISNIPNPTKGNTTIKYEIPYSGDVSIELYNNLGQIVATILHEWKDSGKYIINFDTSVLESGVYYFRIKLGSQNYTNKMIVIE